jgi:hypothetical protein
MRSKGIWVVGPFCFAAALLVLLLPPGARLNAKPAAAQTEEPVPAYHAQPPTGALPETMDATQFDNPLIKNAYALAAKVKKVLYQQPCYCHCDPTRRSCEIPEIPYEALIPSSRIIAMRRSGFFLLLCHPASDHKIPTPSKMEAQ